MKKHTRALACALVWALAQSVSSANMIVLHVDPLFGSTEATGCTADILLSFSQVGSDDRLTVEMKNTSPAALDSKLTAAGFELPPTLDLHPTLALASSYFKNLKLNVAVSPGKLNPTDGAYDVMITKDGAFESGGSPNGGPTSGQSQTVVLSLGDTGKTLDELETAFSGYYSSVTGYDAIARFRGLANGGSDKVVGDHGHETPEPASLGLLAVGAIGVLGRSRRKPV